MRVLVTGAGGFVGPYLLEELRNHGHQAIGSDRPGSKVPSDAPCDLSSRDAIAEVYSTHRPDAVVHLAGWSHVGDSWNAPSTCFAANTINTINLYEGAATASKPPRLFLFVSSADVYGSRRPEELPLSEATTPRVESPYAVSKMAAEDTLRMMHRKGGPAVIIARPFNHLGRGQATTFMVPAFSRQIAEIETGSRTLLKHGNLSAKRDFLDVRDVVRAYRLILDYRGKEHLFVISSGRSVSVRSVVEELFDIAGVAPAMEQDTSLCRPVDTPELRGDSSLLRRETGWEPTFSLRESLQTVLEEARERIAAAR